MHTQYTLANTGRKVTPLEGEICWKPSRDWRKFPVRISELADTDYEHDGKPFAFGYLYDTNYDMTAVIIHCVSEMIPRHVKLYKEHIYNGIEDYYYSHTYSNPTPPRGIEDFVEIQLEDGEWVSFKTYCCLHCSALLPSALGTPPSSSSSSSPMPPKNDAKLFASPVYQSTARGISLFFIA